MTYDDFEGPIKCMCGAMLEIRIEEGVLKGIKLVPPLHPGPSGRKEACSRLTLRSPFRPGQAP